MRTGHVPHPSDLALPLLLAALTVLLGFEAGGYFADTTGWAAAGLAVALGASALVLGRPPLGLTTPLLVAAAALALLALWTLLSGEWSGAWGRALIEFDRVLLYLLALLLFATAATPRWTLRRLPAAFVLAAFVLCGAGLFVLTLPDSWPFDLPVANTRLEYPLGYENALGALAAIGLVLALHVTSWRAEPLVVRVLAAATLPVLAATLILTFSRGALLAAAGGVVVFLLLGMTRGAVMALVAVAVPVWLAANGALDADLLGSSRARSPAGLEQGEELAVLIGLTMAGAAVLRVITVKLEPRLPHPSLELRRPAVAVAVAGVVLVAVGVALATVGSDAVDELSERFDGGTGNQERQPGQRRARERFTNISVRGQSRSEYWRVALDSFEEEPLRGSGAGTYANDWARDRPFDEDVTEPHSLFLGVLAELGAVGGALLLAALVAIFVPFVAGLRRRSRPLNAAMLGAGAVWVVHGALDWDWEMPVLNLWLFAAAGCVLASSPRRVGGERLGRWPVRIAVAVLCLLLALTPAAVAVSQGRLDRAYEAFLAGDCDEAERAADDSISVLGSRSEPYALLAYCAARRGESALSIRRMNEAIERDPGTWQLVYGLALVRGAAGVDPRPAAQEAKRLNPRDELTRRAVNRFDTNAPRVWRREAIASPLPLLVEPGGP